MLKLGTAAILFSAVLLRPLVCGQTTYSCPTVNSVECSGHGICDDDVDVRRYVRGCVMGSPDGLRTYTVVYPGSC